ncbi:MAG TPA: GAF domain-containing protein, partial [Dongiaceae bacterium]|nr:GAF domain-containing protein [Dongiaceae bacterium]
VDLCLDLVDCPEQILTKGQVVWTNDSGRAGIQFSVLPADSLSRLREWLFVNVMAGVANSEVELPNTEPPARTPVPPTPNYTDALAAVAVVQRQVEALGPDLAGALQLIAERAQSLLRASGAAIALADTEPDSMICRATSGSDAPPIGARLQVGSGFSGECVRSGTLLRCDDTELDSRVDPETCRALGIRSILAAPVRTAEKSMGLVEVFSANPHAFSVVDEKALLKFADTIMHALDRAARSENLPTIGERSGPDPFPSPQGSVLFASSEPEHEKNTSPESHPSISLPRSYLFLLTLAAAAISMTLGLLTAPWIQSTAAPWIGNKLRNRGQAQLQTVLASSNAPVNSSTGIETASLPELKQMAEKGNPEAQNTLGLHYATGDGVTLDEREALRWFTRAAESGNVAAQSKLGSIYYSGRGVPQDPNQAYFWMVVARLNGDDASKTLAPFVRARLTRAQVAAIEQDASRWLEQHGTSTKPSATQAKSN